MTDAVMAACERFRQQPLDSKAIVLSELEDIRRLIDADPRMPKEIVDTLSALIDIVKAIR